MAESVFQSGHGAIFIQYGANTEPFFLGKHMIEEISGPKGDKTLQWSKDGSAPAKFNVAGSYRGAPESVTFSIEALLGTVADYLERIGEDKFNIIVNKHVSGRADQVDIWDRTSVIYGCEVTNVTEAGVAARSPDGQGDSLYTVEISADGWVTMYPITIDRQNTTEVNAANDVFFLTKLRGYAVHDPTALATANVSYTVDGGANWVAMATDPFAADEPAVSVTAFYRGRSSVRVLVARGSKVAEPQKVAYTDDNGANWTLVSVGAVNAQGPQGHGSLFSLDLRHIWLCTTGGYIYFSADGGATWSAQEAGVTTVQNLNSIHFADSDHGICVGAAGTVLTTVDGGDTWSLKTAPSADALNSCCMVNRDDAWAGGTKAAGASPLWYTEDGGTIWSARTLNGLATGVVRALRFDPASSGLLGYAVHNTATPVGSLYLTKDGGYTWELITTPANSGLNGLSVWNANLAYLAGEANGGTAVLMKANNSL